MTDDSGSVTEANGGDRAAGVRAWLSRAMPLPAGDAQTLALLLGLHVVAWTLYGTIAHGVGSLHFDMLEIFYWGQVPQLGYYKHPPLAPWVAWAWFHVFPIAEWSYYLLAAVNSAVGLAGVAALTRFFRLDDRRAFVVAFLALTPIYGFMALKFNANAMLIPIWPWAAYFFFRSLETRKISHAALFGALSALAMLGKYYSALLLATFLLASFISVHARAYWRSPAPYVALAIGSLLLLPHLMWSMSNGYPTITYAVSKFRPPFHERLGSAGLTTAAPVLFLGFPLALIMLAGRVRPGAVIRGVWQWLADRQNAPFAAVAMLPFLLTVGFGFAGHAKVSLNYTIPIFFMAPLVVCAAVPACLGEAVRGLITPLAVAFMALLVIIAPFVAWTSFSAGGPTVAIPVKELAEAAGNIWRRETGGPLAIVGGDGRFSGGLSFYDPDHPLYISNLNPDQAPWVTTALLRDKGILIICGGGARCAGSFPPAAAAGTKSIPLRLKHHFLWWSKHQFEFNLLIVPPANRP